MNVFVKKIEIIGVNPYVEVPDNVLQQLFKQAGRDKGPLPVHGTLNGEAFIQTVMKYQGLWRLYLNTQMREATKTQVGDTVTVMLEYDDKPRTVEMPIELKQALDSNEKAKMAFEKLSPSRQKEICRYLGFIKSEETLQKNIDKTIDFLTGKKVDHVLFR